jgi:iron complex outermembrane recepter protein
MPKSGSNISRHRPATRRPQATNFKAYGALNLSASLVALLIGMGNVGPAVAQEAARADAGMGVGQLEEVVVTARRRAENLQEVPVSVTALSAPELRAQSVNRLDDVQRTTPNLRMREGGGNPSAVVFSIRGQVNNEIIATQDASVGLYVDEMIWARAIGANATLLDLGSVQVLKGPQGTLFGRNTTGGALVVRTNDPTTDALSGQVMLGYGRFDRKVGSAVLNVPINDMLAIRGAIKHVEADHQYKNDFGPAQGNEDNTVGRVKLLFQPTEALRAVVSYERFELNQDPLSWYLQFYNTGAAGANATIANQGAAFGPIQNFVQGADLDKFTNNDPSHSKAHSDTYNAIVSYDLGSAVLKAIVGRRTVFHFTSQDLDGSPYRIQTSVGSQKMRQNSGELQLVGSAFDNRLQYAFGAFAFREVGYDTSTSISLPVINPSNPNFTYGDVRNSAKAIYGQITYKITDALNFTGGVRYSKDKRTLTVQNSSGIGTRFACSIPTDLRVAGATCLSIPLKDSSDAISYTAGLDYEITPDIRTYVKTSKGYRSGGFNLRASTNAALFNPYEPESVTDYEVGLKSELFDRRLRVNVAAFYSDYKNIQRNQNITIATATGGVATISTVTTAATARIVGGEAEFEAILTDELRISGSLGLTDPKYKDFSEPRIVGGQTVIFDRSAENFDFVPKTTASLSAQWNHQLSFADLLLRADYSYTSKLHFVSNFTPAPEPERDTQKGYSLINLRSALKFKDKLEVAIYGKNILAKDYKVTALDFSASLGVGVGLAAPRPTYGVELTYDF